jgi:hypothetical protein
MPDNVGRVAPKGQKGLSPWTRRTPIWKQRKDMIAIRTLFAVLLLLYAVAALLYGRAFRKKGNASNLCRRTLAAVIAAHIATVLAYAFFFHRPIMGSTAEALSILALSLAIAYFLIEWIS